MRYSVVDLFSGAGGLSLGFMQTGKFDIKVAFEKNKNARQTYKKNHPNTVMYEDVCNADYVKLKNDYNNIDVVIGGPPCQGFSNVNRQKNHTISQNNMLIKQYIRAILELQPKAFLLENVSMLKSKTHRFYMEIGSENMIRDFAIPTINDNIPLLEERFRFDGAIKIIQSKELVYRYLWTEEEYLFLNVIYKLKNNEIKLIKSIEKNSRKLEMISQKFSRINHEQDLIFFLQYQIGNALIRYFSKNISIKELVDEIEQPILVQRMLSKAKEIFENNILVDKYIDNGGISLNVRSYTVFDYIRLVLGSTQYGYAIESGILNAADFGAPQKRMRFVVIGVKRALSKTLSLPKGFVSADKYATVYDAISDISFEKPSYVVADDTGIVLGATPKDISNLGTHLRDHERLFNHIITKTTKVALDRFAVLKQGENFHNLDQTMKESTYSDSSRTQNTIYLRLKYNEPSGTVVNVRKSMWIHPEHNRAISVREAARLQTFPDSFVFEGSKDSQYQQVGNAVPPILSKNIAFTISEILDNVKKTSNL